MQTPSKERELRRRLTLNRHDPEALEALAALLRERGELVAAARLLNTRCEAMPGDATAWLALARVWAEAGQPAQGIHAVARAEAAGAPWLDTALLLADLQERAGQLRAAVETWQRIHARHPESLEIQINLASVLRLAGDLDAAITLLEAARARAPSRIPLLNNLANALKDAGRLEDAEALYASLVAQADVPGEAHFNHGLTLLQLGRGDAALNAFRTALAHGADVENTQLQIAETEISLGRFEVATHTLVSLLAACPEAARAYALQAQITPPGDNATALAATMNALLKRPGLSATAREALDFGLGRLHDAAGTPALAQKHFRAANRSVRAVLSPAVRDALALRLEALAAVPPEAWQALAARVHREVEVHAEPIPIFIVGMPRSGTTLLESLLARHPAVKAAGEVDALPALLRWCTAHAPGNTPALERALMLDVDTATQLRAAYVRRITALVGDGGRAFIDKTPFNFEHLGLIHALWPQAQVVLCQREIHDTCLSIYFQQFGALPFSHDLADIARVQVAHEACMRYWKKALPKLQVHDVQYQELISKPEVILAALWAALALESPAPQDAEMTAAGASASERVIRTASRWQVRQGLTSSGQGRAVAYPALVAELDKALAREHARVRQGPREA